MLFTNMQLELQNYMKADFVKHILSAHRTFVSVALAAMVLCGCTSKPHDEIMIDELPPIFPDYVDVTIPSNIAPLNFLVRGFDEYDVTYSVDYQNDNNIEKWHKALTASQGKDINVTVKVRRDDGQWLQYRDFPIHVACDTIDPILTYRLIEPDYEVFSHLQIQERDMTCFDTRNLCDHKLVGNRCMNCHTFGQNRSDLSFMYVRGEGGGMILNRNGILRKLRVQTPEMTGGSVYAQFSPSGRYLVCSTNNIIPAFHAKPENRLEVYDSTSDVYVVDLETNEISTSPLLCDSARMETFPCFTPDGRSIIYCKADKSLKAEEMLYSLYRIGFDPETGRLADTEECIFEAKAGEKTSVCHPRVSPDGRYLLFTIADFGTFPIWHRESDQAMMNLETMQLEPIDVVNSELSDTYHSWSSNSRWFVFASKRDDGLYGRPFIAYVDADGKAHKPFAVPQENPLFYDNFLKSFNAPELGKAKVDFVPSDVQEVMNTKAEAFTIK